MSNVFADVGLPDAGRLYENALRRALSQVEARGPVGDAIRAELERIGRGMKVKDIAAETGLKLTDVRRLLAGDFLSFTLDQLVSIALELDMKVEVMVQSRRG